MRAFNKVGREYLGRMGIDVKKINKRKKKKLLDASAKEFQEKFMDDIKTK